MYETILVPTDGSDHAERAARHALSLAERFDAKIHALGVVNLEEQAGPFDAGGVSDEYLDRLEADAEEWVGGVEALAGNRPVETTVVEGTPEETIVDFAADQDVDLIAMGTRGRSGLTRFVTGSVTEHVVRETDRPVLTVRLPEDSDDHSGGAAYERVLIPTDGSDAASAAVDHGLAVAEAYDAAVHTLYVVDQGAGATGTDAAVPPAVREHFESVAGAATDTVAERAREAGLDAVADTREGSPATALLDYADDESIDFVAMGTHGHTGLDRLLLGSTTERAIRHAEMPVLAVHPGSESTESGE